MFRCGIFASNAWNQNFSGSNAGRQNNDNKTNTNQLVRPVRSILVTVVNTEEVLQAYFDCRKGKRGRYPTLEFEYNLSENIVRIRQELNALTWKPGSSMCFTITNPKPREVWAAQFADRVVHHVIYNRLRPRMEKHFIPTSFACIPGRGTSAATQWAQKSLRRITANWSQDAWALQMDVANFFTSIDQQILIGLLEPFCTEPWLWNAVQNVFTNDVTIDAHLPDRGFYQDLVPKRKSLWHVEKGKGLPIGNLTSQFAANVYMNVLDQRVLHVLRPRFYGRYVDDVLAIDRSREKLERVQRGIEEFVVDELGLVMHPKKTRISPADSGIDFVGAKAMPYRTYLRQRTANNGTANIRAREVEDLLPTANSYLGLARQFDTFHLRGKWIKTCEKLGFSGDEHRTKVAKKGMMDM